MRLHNHSYGVWFGAVVLALGLGHSSALGNGKEIFHLVERVNGTVEVQRGGQTNWRTLRQGDQLRPNDLLEVGHNGSVRVICTSLKIWNSPRSGEFPVNDICPKTLDNTWLNILAPANSGIIDPRGITDFPGTPFMLSPRHNTVVWEPKPVLRWNPVPGASYYEVSVWGQDVNWNRRVKQSEVVYDGPEPLQSGVRYRVVIRTNGRWSSADEVTNFWLLGEEDRQQLQEMITNISQQVAVEEAKVLAIAYVQRHKKLYGVAIEGLEQWLALGNRSGAVSQLLGDLYWEVKLGKLARERYLTGLAWVKQDGNLGRQAALLESLGLVDESLGDLQSTIQWLTEAQEIYRTLGDEARVQQLAEKLARLAYLKERF
ncbi:MAG: hypothetical protein WCO45_17185 [Pseudanabaena sp. ELA607]